MRAVGNDEETVAIGVVFETSKSGLAVLFSDIGSRKEAVLLPLSQIEVSDDRKSVLCPRWLAEEKGLA
jgi:hypothetical protein